MSRLLRALIVVLIAAMVVPAVAQPRRATPARTESPYDARARALASRAIAEAGRPEGTIPLLDLWSQTVRVTPAVMVEELDRVIAARLPEPRLTLARFIRAVDLSAHGDRPGAIRRLAELGFVRDWQVVGPFDNDGEVGFTDELPAEAARSGAFDPSAVYEGKSHPASFRRFPEGAAWSGFVSLGLPVRPSTNVCAIATTTLTVARARTLRLYVGAEGAVKVYWNGEPVLVDGGIRGDFIDRSVAVVGAHAGANRVLVKVCNTTGGLGFYFRTADDRGRPALDVRADASTMPVPPVGHAPGRRATVDTDYDLLRRAAEADGANAAALYAYARYLHQTESDDRDERKARDYAARAFDAEPDPDRAELAYTLAEERGERMRFVTVMKARFPNDPRTRILEAKLLMTGPREADALPLLDAYDPGGVEGLAARRLRAGIYHDLGLERAALSEARAIAAAAPGSFEAHSDLAARLAAAGLEDAAATERSNALALRSSDTSLRRAHINELILRNELTDARRELDELYALVRFDDGGLASLAATYQGIDDQDRALALLEEAIALSPDEPSRHRQLGRLLLRMNRRDDALARLRRVLELRPQDADTRQLLEDLESETRDDEQLATPIESILARRTDDAGYPYSVLHDLTVNTVYDNGLSSSFRQIALQVHDEEGARAFRAYPVQFDPGQSRIDVRSARVYRPDGTVLEAANQFDQPMADPAYRMYFDSLNHVIVFPDLEPGDVIEVRYRVDDVANENLFADYYGDLRVLQSTVPVAQLEYVLRTPVSRRFYMNAPTLPGLTRERSEADGRRIDRYVANDVPALRTEAGMPGMTEVAPYLHVSTYQNWQDVGRWYWGLVHDQLLLDDDLRRTVRDLVADAPDVETKVRRIHDWVVDHTRYVALEFGIHGFKPYRVTQIARRGFGDCKDKASLMYAMLTEAGVPAHLVLVRTRGNGNVSEAPASLAVFDHAIAYVPGLDLYLDGTAEHSGLRELPGGDQGVMVLHVYPEGSELRRTPVSPAPDNRRERSYRFALSADGSAAMEATDEVHGVEAAGIRAVYEAEGTREERLRRNLRAMFPGIELERFEFTGLEDREVPPRINYAGRVPRLAQIDGTGLRLAPSLIEELVRVLAPTPNRNLPLERGTTSSYRERRTYAGTGLRVVELPSGGVAEGRFGRASVHCESQGGEVRCECELRLDVDRVAAADFPAFRAWVEAADRLFRQRIKLEVSP